MHQRKLKDPEFYSREAPQFEVFGSGVKVELRRRRRFVAAWALVTMFCATGLLVAVSQQELEDSAPKQTAVRQHKVLLPIAQIPKGAKLVPSLFVIADAEMTPANEKALHSLDELDDLFARTPISPNLPLTKDLVTSLPPAEMIESLVPPGSRAISLSVDATSGVEGWAKPGVHVDVFVSYLDTMDSSRKTQVVVQNAIVLSFNGWTENMLAAQEAQAGDEVKPANQVGVPQSGTVTLGVRSEDALLIRNVQMLGMISLVLRNADDVKGGSVLVVSEEDFRVEPSAPPPPVPVPAAVAIAPAIKIPSTIRPEASVAYLDQKTGAEIKKEMVRGTWRLGE